MHEADPAAGCGPTIRLDKPPRGATLKGDPNVKVAGHATQGSDAWPIASVTVNDLAASLETDGDFSVPVYSSQGINPLLAIATDDGGQTAQASRSYAFSTKWYAIDAAKPSQSMVADGANVFLAAETWDSNGMHVDVASLVEAYVNAMDFNTLFKNPVTSGSYAGCSYQVNVTNVKHGQIDVALRPVAGGLDLDVVMYDFSADIAVPMGGICPDVSGTASAPMIEVKATIKVSVSAGKPVVQIQNADVRIVPQVEVVVDGIWGFLFNWLVDWFQDTLTGYIEDAIEAQMGAPIEGAIADLLAGFALDQAVTVPAFLPGATPVTLAFKTKLSSITFTDAGSVIGLAATVVAPKKTTHAVLGSIGRAGCLSGWEEPLYFPAYGAAEMGLHDDVLNQVAYAMWWGGGLKFPVDPSLIPQDLSEYGVADLKADVDFLLPPIVTSCNWSEQLQVQVGEVGVHATFDMFGSPSEILMYATVIAPAYLYASGDQIGFALDVPTVVRMDVASASGGLEGGADKITGMIEDQILPVLMDAIRDGAFVSFPIPSVDLGKIHPAFAGRKLTPAVQQVMRSFGYTVLSGSVN